MSAGHFCGSSHVVFIAVAIGLTCRSLMANGPWYIKLIVNACKRANFCPGFGLARPCC